MRVKKLTMKQHGIIQVQYGEVYGGIKEIYRDIKVAQGYHGTK